MSYKGYVQLWCANGHYHQLDCNRTAPQKCGCGKEIVFCNEVDATNCDDYGYIVPDFIEVPAGHQRMCATIPTNATPRMYRDYIDPENPDEGSQWIPLPH